MPSLVWRQEIASCAEITSEGSAEQLRAGNFLPAAEGGLDIIASHAAPRLRPGTGSVASVCWPWGAHFPRRYCRFEGIGPHPVEDGSEEPYVPLPAWA
jgi:hypothetical protein